MLEARASKPVAIFNGVLLVMQLENIERQSQHSSMSAFQMCLPLWQFLPRDISCCTDNLCHTTESVRKKVSGRNFFCMSPIGSGIVVDGSTTNLPTFCSVITCVHRLISPPASDLLQIWSKMTFCYYCTGKCSFFREFSLECVLY